jgi:hypothetical protein
VGALDVTLTGSNVSPTNSANIFTVTNTLTAGGFAFGSGMTINTGTAINEVNVLGTAGPLTIQGHGGNDAVGIGSGGTSSTLANILGSVTVRDTGPTTSLGVDDFGDTTSHPNVTLSDTTLSGLAPANIDFQASGLAPTNSLDVTTGQSPDTITITNTPLFTLLGVSNSTGTELVNVQGITGKLLVQPSGSFSGALTAVVGSPVATGGETLANINGLVDFLEYHNTNLVVDDSGDLTPRTVKMTDLGLGLSTDNGLVTGLAPQATIAYSPSDLFDNSTVTVKGGRGGNVFNVGNTTLFNSLTTIDGGNGGDTFNVTTTQGPLTINTGSASNRVNVQGTSIQSVAGLAGTLSVFGHGGSDTVTVGSLAPALGGTQANVHGPVNVSNITNSTTLIVDDSGDTTPRTVTIGPNSVQFSGIGAPLNFFAGVKSVEVLGGTSDHFQATAAAPTIPVTLVGGPGTNTLVSGAFNNTWHITGTNAGTLQSTITFHNIQNLSGTALPFESDTFFFANGAGITGAVVGGGNFHTTLDYSAYTTPVTVDLKTHVATGVGGGVSFVQNVNGGQGNNILVGNGNNILRGGSGRDILISGGGTSTLQAGSGEAILIGAHYLFDTNPVALGHLMAEWSHTYDPINPLHDYQIRVGHLEHGGGLNDPFLLNSATVVPQPGTTTLTTGGGLDFLITDPGDILTKPLRPGEVDLFV